MRTFITILFSFCIIFIDPSVFGEASTRPRESIIGGFDFTSNLITDQQLMNQFGRGCVAGDFPDHYRRIYYMPGEKIYVSFLIETDNIVVGLELSKELNASTTCKARKSLSSFATGHKVALGDSEKKTVNAYGKPARSEVQKDGVCVYRYYVGRTEGPYMEIKFFNRRVISILITVGD